MEELAYILMKVAKKFMKLGIKDVKVISASELDKKVKAQVKTENWFWDRKYYYTNLENWKEIVKRTHVEEIRYIGEVRDCIAPDTPLVVRFGKNPPQIVEVSELVPHNWPLNEPYYPENLYVHMGRKFVRVNWILKKRTGKPFIRLFGDTAVDVTVDHRVLVRDGYKRDRELKVNSRAKSYFLEAQRITGEHWFRVSNVSKLFDKDEHGDYWDREIGWVYGFFVADGTAGVYPHSSRIYNRYSWHIDNTDERLLEWAKSILEEEFRKYNLEFHIDDYPSQRRDTNFGKRGKPLLRLNVYSHSLKGGRKEFILKFVNECYTTNRNKKVPDWILNGNIEIKKGFIEGIIDGDGYKSRDYSWEVSTKSKILALGVSTIARNIGYIPSTSPDKKNVRIRLSLYKKVNKGLRFVRARLKSINIHYNVVYDINTSAGMFSAGNIIVHNCDDIAMIMHSRVSEIFELNAFATVLGAVYEDNKLIGYHAWNAFYCDEGTFFLEPQTDEIAKAGKDKTKVGNWLYEPFLMIWY